MPSVPPPAANEIATALDLSGGEPVSGVMFVLRVVAGPDTGATLVLDGVNEGRILLGQSAVCTLRLTDRAVSRRHAALRREAGAWRLEDLESTNGTRVNGVRVKEAFLSGGELVTLGSTSVRLTRAGVAPAEALPGVTRFGRLVSGSAELRRHFPYWASLAASSQPLLLEGETGTGKELLAEALHDLGPRAGRPFVVLDCSDRGERAIEALFEQASGGTLVIDEPSALDPPSQAILFALVARSARVETEPSRSAARVITTSRTDLDMQVQHGRFREDLLHALAGVTIELPPLRRRKGDVELLARHFWKQLGGPAELAPEELSRLGDLPWPGNVRELLDAVAELLPAGAEAPALASLRPGSVRPPPAERVAGPGAAVERILALDLPYVRARQEMLREFEAHYVGRVLEQQGGNVSRAAAASGLARRYFQILRSRAR